MLDGLATLGFRDGTLYGTAGYSPNWDIWLLSIDPETGNLTQIVELTDFSEQGPWCLIWPSDMDFDDHGGLWVAANWFHGCVTFPFPVTGMHFYADPFDGTLTSRSRVADGSGSSLHLDGLAVNGPPQPILDVPTLSFGGALTLVAVLAAAALALVRRRH